ncbi:hypothetical protein J7E68_07710 [Microbacterium sp. ISL-103]|uniref:hypothetical protein n=1 Tax=Microbacterium sp. ISL-103 TaxID=2819156 RepID=UPI001BEC74C3|nr:hypothetical protein [Microbacterium sp. ISL-103]MBT2474465.1 hypothetical protein [Microbacterium sp. ISL-103]
MLHALIRPVESSTADVIGTTLAEVIVELDQHRKPGFDLVSAPVRMLKGEAKMEATGTFKRVDGVREIDAEDMTALKAKVPDGWLMLTVRHS